MTTVKNKTRYIISALLVLVTLFAVALVGQAPSMTTASADEDVYNSNTGFEDILYFDVLYDDYVVTTSLFFSLQGETFTMAFDFDDDNYNFVSRIDISVYVEGQVYSHYLQKQNNYGYVYFDGEEEFAKTSYEFTKDTLNSFLTGETYKISVEFPDLYLEYDDGNINEFCVSPETKNYSFSYYYDYPAYDSQTGYVFNGTLDYFDHTTEIGTSVYTYIQIIGQSIVVNFAAQDYLFSATNIMEIQFWSDTHDVLLELEDSHLPMRTVVLSDVGITLKNDVIYDVTIFLPDLAGTYQGTEFDMSAVTSILTTFYYSYDTTTPLPTNPSKDGYNFTGWFTDQACTDFYNGTPVDTQQTLYAGFEVIPYTISFFTAGGDAVNSIGYNIESAMVTLPSAHKNGYTFAGWYDNPQGTGNKITTVATGSWGDKSYYAQYSLVTYNVTLHLNGGVGDSELTYNIESGLFLTTPSKSKYLFLGWYDNAELSGIPRMALTIGEYGDKELYARWVYNWVTVTFLFDEEVYKTIEVERGTVLVDHEEVAPLLQYISVADLQNVVNNDMTVQLLSATAGNSKTAYSDDAIKILTFQALRPPYADSIQITASISIINNVLTITNLACDSMYNVTDAYFGFVLNVYKSSELVKSFETEDYSVDFNSLSYGAYRFELVLNPIDVQDKDLDEYRLADDATPYLLDFEFYRLVAVEDAPEQAGYEFIGWFLDEELTQPFTEMQVFEDIALYAKYELIEYTITFISNGGDAVDAITYTILDAVEITAIERVGYDFIGWYSNEELTGNAVIAYEAGTTGNMTLYAKWTIKHHSIKLYVNGVLYKTVTVEYGTLISDAQEVQQFLSIDGINFLSAPDSAFAVTDDVSIEGEVDDAFLAGLLETGLWVRDNWWIPVAIIGGIILVAIIAVGATKSVNNSTPKRKKNYRKNGRR